MLATVVAVFVVLFGMLRDPGTQVPHDVSLGPGVRPSQPPADLGPDETWLGDVDLSSSALVTPQGPLRAVEATGINVRVTRDGLRVGEVRLVATLPFDVAEEQVGQGVQLYDAGGNRVGVRRSATLLGVDVAVSATGTVRAVGGDLLITPESVDIGLPGLVNDALSNAARELVTIRQSIQGLPAGLHLTDVTVRADGFRATLRGTDVTIAG